MPDSNHHDFIQRLPYLRELDPSELQPILQALEQESYSAGDIIAQQGTPARGILLILEGRVGLIHHDSEGEIEHELLVGEGQSLGVMEVVNGVPWWGTLRARRVTTLLRWPRPAISLFIQSHPRVLSDLKHTARMQKMLYRQKFGWLGENEAICAIARKHQALIIQSLLLPIFAIALGIASWIWTPFGNGNLSFWVGLGMCLAGLGLGLWRWVDWGNDFSIVTNRRAVMLEKVIGIYDNRQETPLQWVLSVSVGTGALGRLLGFGDLIIRTYTGELVFRNVPNPFMFASIVEDQWMRYKHRRNLTDREDIAETIKERISASGEVDPESEGELSLIDRQIHRTDKGESKIGLDRWTLKTRFEEQGVITYRKHWAILLRQIFAPSLLIALTIVLLVLRITGTFEELERGVSLLIGAFVIFISLLWWLYRYIDWANDIYQITPNHIVDVNKKPLAREVRMIAPLENILGTEIDRTGIFGVILNFGSVVANVGTAEFSFDGVYDPARVQQDIVFAQDSFLERQAEVDRIQRRDEVVEWLSAYHNEVNPPDTETEESNEINDNP
jgi:CRP-like cAMP-binding protein